MKGSFAIIGCGRAGLSFTKFLYKAGYPPAGLSSRSLQSANLAAEIIGFKGKVSTKPWEVLGDADIVLITTPDHVIREIAEKIAGYGGMKPGVKVFHCSGALSSDELSALKGANAKTGSIHPLQSFGSHDSEINPFKGIMVGIEGDRECVDAAWQMAKDLGATPFEIQTSGKMLYHAAAVVASNYLVTLLKFAIDLLGASGVESDNRFEILKPLIMGTLSNIENAGAEEALTGPIRRGDTAVVRAHLEAIEESSPDMSALYKKLGEYTVEIAYSGKSISSDIRDELLSILTE